MGSGFRVFSAGFGVFIIQEPALLSKELATTERGEATTAGLAAGPNGRPIQAVRLGPDSLSAGVKAFH